MKGKLYKRPILYQMWQNGLCLTTEWHGELKTNKMEQSLAKSPFISARIFMFLPFLHILGRQPSHQVYKVFTVLITEAVPEPNFWQLRAAGKHRKSYKQMTSPLRSDSC